MRLGLGLGVKNSTFVGGYDPAAAAFLAATGITGKTESDAINDLVVRLKGYNLWDKMKAIYPFVSDTYNLVSYSEDFNSWIKSNTPVTVNAINSPTGTLTADKLVADTVNTQHSVSSSTITVTAGLPYTRSVYVKKGEYSNIVLTIGGFAAYNDWKYVAFNLDTNTFTGASGSTTYGYSDAGNGWVRIWFTVTPTTTGSDTFTLKISNNPNNASQGPTFAGDGTSGLYVWGAQFQQSATVTTYQPISTTADSRFVSQFKYNLKDPRDLDAAFRLAFSGTWAYTKQGATPNGVNAFADTKLNPTTVGFTQTDTHISAYLRTDSNGSKVDIGGSYNLFMGARWVNNYNYPINRSNNANGTSSDSIGYFLASRVDNVRDRMFKNGTNVTNFNTAAVSLDNNTIMISATNGGGLYSDRQTAFNTIGNGLTDQDAANLYTSIQIYQQDLSRAVGTPIAKVSDLSAQSYVAATQIQNTVYATAVDVFVKGMKAVGLWEKMKAVYPFVSDNINQFGYTEDFTYNPMWGQNRCTMASNVTTAPDGTMTADSFTTTSTTLECQLRASITSPYNNVTQTTSVYAKKSTANYFRIRNLSSGGNAWFNLTNGTIGTIQGGQTATMTSVGNGWYRCTLTGTKGVSATDLYDIGFTDTDGTHYPTASVVGFLWGAQLQLGSTATTYIPVASTVDNKFVQQFKYNLMSPLDANGSFRLAFNGTWSYSLQGAKANGTNAYASTFFDGSLNQSTNSNAIGFYANIANTSALSDPSSMGNVRVSDLNGSAMTASGTSLSTRLNNAPVLGTISGATGFFTATKQSATVTKVFKNAAEIASGNSGGIPINDTMLIANVNISGAPYAAGYVSNQFTFAYMSDGLSNAEISNYYTLVQGLQINLNRQV